MSVTQPLRSNSKLDKPLMAQANLRALKTTLTNMGIRLQQLLAKATMANMNLDASGDKEINDHFVVSTQLAYVVLEQYRLNPTSLPLSPNQLSLLFELVKTERTELSTSYTITDLLRLIRAIDFQPTLLTFRYSELMPSVFVRQQAEAADAANGRVSVKTGIRIKEIGKTGKYRADIDPNFAVESLTNDMARVAVDEGDAVDAAGDFDKQSADGSENKGSDSLSSSSSSSTVETRIIRDKISMKMQQMYQELISNEDNADQSDQSSVSSASSSLAAIKKQCANEVRVEYHRSGQGSRGAKSSYHKIGTAPIKTGAVSEPPSIPFSLVITQWFFDENVASIAYEVMRHMPLIYWLGGLTSADGYIYPQAKSASEEAAARQIIEALELKTASDVDSVRAYMLNSVLGVVQLKWAHVLRIFKTILDPKSRTLPLKLVANDVRAINAVRSVASPLLFPQSDVFDVSLLRNHSDVAINQMNLLMIHTLSAALTLASHTGRRLFVTLLPSKAGRTWLDVLKTAISLLRTIEVRGPEINRDKVKAAIKGAQEFFQDVMENHPEFPFADVATMFSRVSVDNKISEDSALYFEVPVSRILMLIAAEMVYSHSSEMHVKAGDEAARQAAVIVMKFARGVTSTAIKDFPYDAFDTLLKDLFLRP